jgi:hypothetical protein
LMKLNQIKANPDNPRSITEEGLQKLCNSIKDFPKMMELRPIIIDSTSTVLAGNMRLKALKKLGYKEIPDTWVKKADQLTEEEKHRFIVQDNANAGDWAVEKLLAEWDETDLEDWGVELEMEKESNIDIKKKEEHIIPFKQIHVLISVETDQYDKVKDTIEALHQIEGIEIELSAN